MSEKLNSLSELKGIPFNKEECVKNHLIKQTENICLYSNLYPIIFTKPIEICEYPFKIKPEVHEENLILKIFRELSHQLFDTYGYYYRSGNSFFAVKKVEEEKTFTTSIIHDGKLDYNLYIKENAHSSTINEGKTHNFSEIEEKVLFLIIREILSANPNVHFDRDNLYLENRKKEIIGTNKYFIHDGYKISIQQADYGICLIIGVKNKIKGQFTVYDLLEKGYKSKDLIGRRFIPFEGSRHQQISGIVKDKNPTNTTRNYKKETISYYDYYKKYWGIDIKHKNQPLILVNIKDPQYKERPKYYVPELSTLIGINDDDSNNNSFMKQIIKETRLEPNDKIEQIEKCLELFNDVTEKKVSPCPDIVEVDKVKIENLNTIKNDPYKTSKEKRLHYGIEIKKLEKPIRPYYIKQPTFTNRKNIKLTIKDINKVIPVARECMNTDEWICLYSIQAEKESFKLLNGFIKCSKGYGIKFKNDDSNWIPIKSIYPNDWIKTVEQELKYRKNCMFVIFLLSKNSTELYTELKKHSLHEKGYISQVIKLDSLKKAIKNKKGPDSYYSKILLQINNKIGGFNYYLNTEKFIDDEKIMLIGVDSSHIWGMDQRTGVSMVSTKDKNFSKFFSRQEILRTDEHYASETRRVIHAFIRDAHKKYFKENKEDPKSIIIYRQGIAHNQLKYVELEVKLIEEVCKELKLKYYYIIVNTRVSIKFFEYNYNKDDFDEGDQGDHKNPEQGLIVLDQVTNIKRFEFYIQPQKVNIGSATPTYFHVAYGNMEKPELLIQLTYWTTYLYSNWQNAVRVPHVIKMAEKLAYMTAKFTQSELNDKLSDTQSFL